MIVHPEPLPALPRGRLAAAGIGGTVWVAAGAPPVLRQFAPDTGKPLGPAHELDSPAEVVAATTSAVLVASRDGRTTLFNPDTLERLPAPNLPRNVVAAAGGNDGLWMADRDGTIHLVAAGERAESVHVGAVTALAADADAAWAAIAGELRLRRIERSTFTTELIDPGIGAARRGTIATCANACFVSGPGVLAAVASHPPHRSGTFSGPGPTANLACVTGAIVGGDDLDAVFALDPAADAEVTHLEVPASGRIAAVVATGRVAWIVGEERRDIWLVEH